MKILLYTFYNRWWLCSRVVWDLLDSVCNTPLEKYYINGLRGINGLLENLKENDYDFVIGMGDYRKSSKKIRIESRFINKYGRNKILEDEKDCCNTDVVFINEFVVTGLKPVTTEMQISTIASNGLCNRSAYLVSELIERKGLETMFLFLHVPRELALDRMAEIMHNVIVRLLNERDLCGYFLRQHPQDAKSNQKH